MISPFFFKNKGFTLTEAVIAITIFVLIITAIYSVYNLSHQAYLEGEKVAEITQNGRVILERIVREIRQAKEIVTDLESGATSTIEFQDGHDVSTIHYIHYFKDGTDVKREEIAYYLPGDSATYVLWDPTIPQSTTTVEEARVIGEYVAGLEFWGSSIISVSTTLAKGDKSINFRTRVFRRNP